MTTAQFVAASVTPPLILLLGLGLSVITNPYIVRTQKKLMVIVPALTIQPIVENAIRHGVRSKEKGVVRVQTFCEDGCHVIRVTDNGVGFDTAAAF